VILATAEQVIMEENLGLALARLFGSDLLAEPVFSELAGGRLPDSATTAPATAAPIQLTDATVEQLIVQANDAYVQAQAALRNGDWSDYGARMETLQATLQQLVQLTGSTTGAATGQ
jgi:uncharacterized protein